MYWMRILSATKVSSDNVLLSKASKIFKLPPACIDKHFKERKQEYVDKKGPKYEMALERCTTCKTKTKIIGGGCIHVTHQEIVEEQKMQKAKEKTTYRLSSVQHGDPLAPLPRPLPGENTGRVFPLPRGLKPLTDPIRNYFTCTALALKKFFILLKSFPHF